MEKKQEPLFAQLAPPWQGRAWGKDHHCSSVALEVGGNCQNSQFHAPRPPINSRKLKQVTRFQMQQGIHPYSFGRGGEAPKKGILNVGTVVCKLFLRLLAVCHARHSCIVPQPRSGAQCICQGAAVQHRGSHFKKPWKREGLQLHIGMRDLAGVTWIVQLFLFKEERILIVCYGEKG